MDIENMVRTTAKQAKQASYELAKLDTNTKNTILLAMSKQLIQFSDRILEANHHDVQRAKKRRLREALIDRLLLTHDRIEAMAKGLNDIVNLPDPIGTLLSSYTHPDGLLINKVRTPIGVIAVIYESRPNVAVEVTSLCLKTGNALILRSGQDARESTQTIVNVLIEAGIKAGLPRYALQQVPVKDRNVIGILATDTQHIDLIIPRGGPNLIHYVADIAKVPVIKHYQGICHTYVDQDANIKNALAICENAKCQRPGVCNAMETLLVHQNMANTFLPQLAAILLKRGVELRGDQSVCELIPEAIPATDQDWETEYCDLILSIKVIHDVNEAIYHINQYGSHHSDAIVSDNQSTIEQFLQCVDSAAVYANASTRFTDGSEFGMGAEMGISTDKLHVRGPMGLNELTSYQYRIVGNGQIR